MTRNHEIEHEPIPRPRLLEAFGERFERRCTVIRAGAGFGKTTLIEQAIQQNRLHPRGIDLHLRCRPTHRFAEALTASLARLCEAPEIGDPIVALRDWIWHRSPVPVALILDDVHEISADSSAAGLLSALLQELPANGHLVFSGRTSPPIAISRLRARRDLLEFDEKSLAFDEQEIERFKKARRIPDDRAIADISWPALLELRTAAGSDDVVDFLLDEVLSHLDEERRSVLARVARFEILDDALIRRSSDSRLSARELTESLPLVRKLEADRIAIHALWKPALARLPGANDPQVLRTAARRLAEYGETEASLALLMELGDSEAVRDLLRDLSQTRSRNLGNEALRAILREMPRALRDSADGTLLDALTTLRDDPERSAPQLTRAARLYRASGDAEGELRTLIGLGHLAYFKGDVAKLRELADRGRRLADAGVNAALPLAWVAEATGALVRTEPEKALELIDRARSLGLAEGVPDFMVAVLASLDAGRPERAIAEIDRAKAFATPEIRGALEITRLTARWQCGRASLDDLDAIRPWLTPDTNDSVHNLAVHLAILAQIATSLGAVESAKEFDVRCQDYLDRSFDGRASLSLAIGRAALHTLEGDEEKAASHLWQAFETGCFEGRPNRHALRGLAFFYLLVPETRERIDELELSSGWSPGRAIGRALVALRENGDTAPAATLDWDRAERFTAFVVPSLLTELEMGALAGGANLPRSSQQAESAVREWLRRVGLRGPEASRRAAMKQLRTLPILPKEPVEIRTLGTLELRRGGKIVESRDWRRSRVRLLLLHLVTRPGCRREELGAALWPDRDQESVGNNLRVNLHHLMRVLQPERQGGERPWFLRQEGDRLWLTDHPLLRIDARDFERACDAASKADRSGVPGVTLEHCLDAVQTYRGDFSLEADGHPSIDAERTRLRNRFMSAARRAGELLLATGDTDPLLELSTRLIHLDPLSELAYRLQAHAYRHTGDLATARAALEHGLSLLSREGLRPDAETRALARELEIPR